MSERELDQYKDLSRRLLAELNVRRREVSEIRQPVAVVGMACRFPGGGGLEGFWRLLKSGGDAVTAGRPSPVAGPVGRVYGQVPDEGTPVQWGAFIEGVDLFDAEFFRIAPVEARSLDPQQRLLLETSWEALESAGIDAERLRGSRTGVYAGVAGHDYWDLMADSGVDEKAGLYLATGNMGSTAIGRVAFALGLEGPAVAVDTSCSSSLVAVHQAVLGLQRKEADLALAGGVNLLLSPVLTGAFRSGGMLSPDGRCKTFDASANGYVRGEGCGLVVLKRLSEAEADGDSIWGVIRGSAVNHDGSNAGLTVPSGSAQERVIATALARAGLEPWEVDYLEAHGTGTELGDPIEVYAAAAAYGAGRRLERPLLLGSVKTNVGHLEAAAGVAGLIKVLLSLAHGVIPKHLHFREPNPHVDWQRLPVRVASEGEVWPSEAGRPARAAVSSFGFSGTNSHVVVEGYGERTESGAEESRAGSVVAVGWPAGAPELRPEEETGAAGGERERRLLALSGRTEGALRELAGRYAEWLEERVGSSADGSERDSDAAGKGFLADMAWTAGVGRSHHEHRAGLTFAGVEELREKLGALASGAGSGVPSGRLSGGLPKVGFLFTGQGSQWAGMGRDLYEREPVFRAVLDRCEAAVRELRGESLLAVMFGEGNGDAGGSLDDTRWTQPALYALEAGLSALWAGVGVRPAAVLGHSVGEIAAAYAAGVFTLEEGVRFAAQRGELMGSLPVEGPAVGAMAAVFGTAGAVEGLVAEVNAETGGEGLSVAAYNGAHQVVSGAAAVLEVLLERCAGAGLRAERLRVSHGFHSGLMEPVLSDLEALLESVEVSAPEVDLVSDLTGAVMAVGEAMDGVYWRRHARQPVAFAAGVAALAGLGVDVLVELGPGPVLGGMAALAWPAAGEAPGAAAPSDSGSGAPAVLSSLAGKGSRSGDGGFVEAVAGAYAAGLGLSFAGLFVGEQRRRVSLPAYPFQRQRYWADATGRGRGEAGHPLLGVRRESAGGETTFEKELYASAPEWLSEHRVFGRVAASVGLYGAMALNAAALAAGGASGRAVAVEDVRIDVPLVLPEGSGDGAEPGRTVQVVVGGGTGPEPRGVKVYSREGAAGEWTLHAEALASVGVAGAGAGADMEALRRDLSEWDVADFYRDLVAEDLALGPSFRTLQRLWRGDGEALGEVWLEEGSVEGEARVLDGCFQVVGAAFAEEPGTWMPVGWERLWVGGPLPEQVTCHARLREPSGSPSAPEEVRTGDLWLYGGNGAPLGAVVGLVLKPAARSAFLSAAGRAEGLLYAPEWREAATRGAPQPAAFLLPPEAAASEAGTLAAHLEAAGLSEAAFAGLREDLERLSRAYAVAALDGLGWRRERGAGVSTAELRPGLKVVSEHAGLFGRVLGLAADAGVLERLAGRDGPEWHVALGSGDALPDGELEDPAALAAALKARHRPGSVELGLLSRCGAALAEVLRGRAEPLELLFDEAGPNAADLYRDAPVARAVSGLLAEWVGAAVSALPAGRRLRVLEVGAGTGGTTGAVLPRLPADRFEYMFTDVSAGFFAAAQERFGKERPALSCRVLDIEQDPVEQGFRGHGYDVVVAANVLHATRDMSEALGHCRRLLAPGGLLAAVEGLGEQGWLDLTFGMLEGWWRFAEGADRYRADYPLMAAADWRRALGDAGFGEAVVASEAEGASQGVIMARGPAEVEEPAGLWLVASDRSGEGRELAAALAERNQRVVLAVDESRAGAEPFTEADLPGMEWARLDTGSRDGWRGLVERVGADEAAPLRGVVHLAGLSGHGPGAGGAELAADVERVLGSGLALAQGLMDAGVEPGGGLWLVTRGGQVVEGERGGELAGAPLWGLGKTLAWEAGRLKPRLVDLDPDAESGLDGLVDELLYPDRETEVAYRGGVRLAHRLVRYGPALPEGAGPGPELRDRGTYLVTGGPGGIGLEVAGWLADHGARNIVLNGRGEPDAAAQAALAALRGRGVEVRLESADVADAGAVAAMLERVEAAMPPLAGVVHGAVAVSDASLGSQDWGRFERVLRPKVLGAWHLHRAMKGRELDLFVLFSGVAGVLGSPGQANRSAADAFLDQLARHRRSLGLEGRSIAWGAWSGADGAEERPARTGERSAMPGVGRMTPLQALEAFDRVLRGGAATTMAAPVDWDAYGAGVKEAPAFLQDLAGAGAAKGSAAEFLERLRAAPAADRQGLLLGLVQAELQAVLQLSSPPAAATGFFDLGMDSLMAVEFRNRLSRGLAGLHEVSRTVVFDYGSPEALARHLAEELGVLDAPAGPARRAPLPRGDDRIAVVGMACRFPGGGGLDGFWSVLESGRDAVTEGRASPLGDPAERLYGDAPDGGSWAGFIEGVDLFDADFFRIAPVEACVLDPQQRLLLETSWEALESAGIDAARLKGSRTGVYAGITTHDYWDVVAAGGEDATSPYFESGNTGATAIGRVAFTLGLEGPALAVDTACSSSLVALHQAVSGLQRREADLALAGGVNVLLSAFVTEGLRNGGMLSPEGHCKTFDASADGYVRGEGCGVVVLKRLRDAEADGDRIWGVIRGSAINHDGASAGLTVPNGSAQERVIGDALASAGLEPWEVDYLEAHGTGTELGDPIEVRAAAAAYGPGRDAGRPLLLGAVKTNIGHLEAAAGVAGLIKVLLSMNHGVIPRHLHFREPNPHVDWARLPVRVVSEPEEWPSGAGRPARAAVSSFGFSGTNAHVVVEAYGAAADARGPDSLAGGGVAAGPAVAVAWPEGVLELRPAEGGGGVPVARERRLLPLSAQTEEALRALAGRYAGWLEEREPSPAGGAGEEWLADMAWTAGIGRSHHGCRAGVTFGEAGELREKLGELASAIGEGSEVSSAAVAEPKVGFLFTGQGSQWAGMGRELYEREPVFRAVLDRCESEVQALRGESLLAVMFGEEGSAGSLDDTRWTQPALYTLEAGLTALWASVGVKPSAVLGHGVGEIAAAHAAGVFWLEAGLRFAAQRGELMASLPAQGLEELEGLLDGVEAAAPAVTLVSNVTGAVWPAGEVMDGVYWRRQARERVAFGSGVSSLAGLGVEVLVELGPRPVLGRMVALAWPAAQGGDGASSGSNGPVVLSSLAGRTSVEGPGLPDGGFVEAAAGAYAAGLGLSFEGLFVGEERRRVSLPGYPFQRRRYWTAAPRRRRAGDADHPWLGERRESARGETTFETELYPSEPEWLADHRVFGRVVVPGAMYGTLALSAAFQAAGRGGAGAEVGLADMRFHAPLLLPEAAGDGGEPGRTVQVVLGEAGGSPERTVEVYSRGTDEAGWTLHAEARVGTAAAAGAAADLDALKERLSEQPVVKLYRGFEAAGVDLGPSFRAVRRLWSGAEEALGEVSAPESLEDRQAGLHPVLLDGCFQVLVVAFVEREEQDEDDAAYAPTYLPFGWERLWVRGALPERVMCHARLRAAESSDAWPEVMAADLWLYRPDGEALGEVSGLVLKRATPAALLSAATGGEDLLYRVAWREVPAAKAEPVAGGPVLLVSGTEEESGEILAFEEALARRGVEVIRGWDPDPARLPGGIVVLAPAWSGEPASLSGALGWLLDLVKTLLAWDASIPSGLCVVTRSAVPAEPGESVDPVAASLWGFGRSMQMEQPGLGVRMVDVEAGVPGDDGRRPSALSEKVLAAALMGGGGEDQLAVRGDRLLAPRLERHAQSGAWTAGGVGVRADRSYLVTGGLGYLGLELAGWLARAGAGHVVLVSRRAPDEATRERLAALEAETGCRLVTERADVAEAVEVTALLVRFARDGEVAPWPPLAGVFHAAGVSDDGVLTGQTAARFEGVLRPKAWGAWHLHRGTLDRELDLFVLYSSVSATMGAAGLGGYPAANAFLDGLAALRRSTGLPATSVGWGAWGGGGMAGSGKAEVAATQLGLLPMTAERAHGGLEQLLRSGLPSGLVLDADWRRMSEFLGGPPILSAVAPAGAQVRAREQDLLAQVRAAAASEREGLLLGFVQRELQAVLQAPWLPAPGVGFFDLGMDSLMAVEFRNRLNRGLGDAYALPSTAVFDYASPEVLARHLAEATGVLAAAEPVRSPRRGRAPREDDRIAVVGMGCRFPGGGGVAGFWRLLESGGDAVTDGRPASPGSPAHDPSSESELGPCSFIEDVDLFDAEFFRIAPVEARLLDPQQRLLLETSWEALESAGIGADRLRGSRTGVYVGIFSHDYLDLMIAAGAEDSSSLYLASGNNGSTAIGRVAFTLGLEGPAVAVDTACSSSLVAVHQAVSGLQRGEADLALAGGVNVLLSPVMSEVLRSGGALSPDGRCKAFDASADGYGRGEGCGVLVLKRLREAEADGDRIWGVIRGSAVNHDGASAGLTVPNGPAQERVIEEALARAGVEPREVDYLETHGTGTELGDPIEVHAATAVYGAGREPARPLLLGSVKTNIGHLEAAAGVAGLIKVLLSMAHGVIPKHLHFHEPTPHVEWERLPVRVVSEAETLPPAAGRPACSGVSSFGLSGTNAHVVVEGYGAAAESDAGLWTPAPAVTVGWPEGVSELRPVEGGGVEDPRKRLLLPLSGRTDEAVRALAGRYMEWLEQRVPVSGDSGDGDSDPAGTLTDAAWTAGVGRSHLGHRAGVTFGGVEELRDKLAALASGAALVTGASGEGRGAPAVAFLFTGQGSQWPGMGRELYRSEPVFRAVLDRCEREVKGLRGESLLAVMFGDAPEAKLDDTRWTQPALYALESGLAALWRSVGVTPAVVLGHSVGEIAAASAAGVFSLEAGVRFAAMRGELMASLPVEGPRAGSMAAVFAPPARVEALVAEVNEGAGNEGLGMAAYNGGHQVVSGGVEAVGALLERCGSEGVRAERLRVSHAFHSALMEPVLDGLEGLLAGEAVSPPRVALVSNVTGGVMRSQDVLDGAYWRRHARAPVAFAAGVGALAEMGVEVLVELGPRPVLGTMAALAWPVEDPDGSGETRIGGDGAPAVLSSLGQGADGAPGPFVEAVAAAYAQGLDVTFEGLFVGEERRRLSLPTYPFQRRRYWAGLRRRRAGHPLLGEGGLSARGEMTFERELYASEPEWLSDHRVFGRVVAPAALYGAMALSAASAGAKAGAGSAGPVVEELRIHAPLALPEGAGGEVEPGCTVQLWASAPDGSRRRSMEIHGRGDGEAEWTLHAEARLGWEARTPEAAGTDVEGLKQRLSEEDAAALYRTFAAAGVEFGASFRALRTLWLGSGEALAEVSLPEGLEAGAAGVHPVLLDGCLQVVGAALLAGKGEEVGTYLPVGWERLWVGGTLPPRVTCHARLRPASGPDAGAGVRPEPGEVLAADLWLYGEDGTVLGALAGLALKRATRAAFLSGVGASEDLLYTPVWRETDFTGAPRPASFLSSPAEAASLAGGREAHLEAEGLSAVAVSGLQEDLERLSQAYAVVALEGLGWRRQRGAQVSVAELRQRLKVVSDHGALFARVLALAADAGVLERMAGAAAGGSEWRVALSSGEALEDVELADPASLAAALGARHGWASTELGLLSRCGDALAEVLRGRVEPLRLLFDEAGPSAADLYRDAPVSRAMNALLAAVVSAAVSGLPEERRLRVLEVGAGTGGTTAAVLPGLPEGRFEYVYTDVSAGFFAAARERFGERYPALEYRVLDLERDPVSQGFDAHGYDVVIAANILHATRDVGAALRHCRRLLAPGGLLAALEELRGQGRLDRTGWLDLIFGLLEGWWRFADGADGHRVDHPLMGAEAWRGALAEAGFGAAVVAGEPGPGQAVIVARGPQEVAEPVGLWVLASEEGVEGLELAAQLVERNQRVVVAHGSAGDAAGIPGVELLPVDTLSREAWRELLERLPEEPRLRGVVHLAALSGHGCGAEAGELAEDLRRGVGSALALAQGLLDSGKEPEGGLWFLTRGAQVVEREHGGELSGAALWGLGRTLALEVEPLRPRMIDLDPGEGSGFGGLVKELLYPDGEREVAYRRGGRLALRLTRDAAALVLPEGREWRLVADADGLESVGAERVAAPALGAGELRVAVEAAGVNYKDSVEVLGLIQGRLLGGEFCGRVTELGPGVRGFSEGDRVVGFAAGTFAPEVVTRAELVARVPAGLSPEQAATIPVVFVTGEMAFELARLVAGERVLVHAGAGGVGLAAIQLAQRLGAEVYATASEGKQEYLRSLGVSHVFDSRSTRFGEEILAETGGAGVDMVLNSLARTGFIEATLSCLAERGRFVEIGKRRIWSEEEMAAARPDVDYHILAVDQLLEDDPEQVGRAFHGVMARVEAGELRPLPYTLWALEETPAALEYLRSGRNVGKLVLRVPGLLSGGLREDGTYLVTGGLGGVGLEVAGWLAERGARSLVLNGRRAPEGEALASVEALREHGVEVRVEVADVTDGAAVTAMLARMDAALPPLAGVFHSVGVLSDASLANQDWGRFERVLWPKVMGAWHLHRATEARDLELFVLFSSAAGVLGMPGQANHAAANAFLDQLARHRRRLGLAAQSIAWGPWSDVGEAEEQRERIGERLAAAVGWMTPRRALGALESVVRRGVTTSVAALMDWEAYVAAVKQAPALLEDLAAPAAGGQAGSGQEWLERLRGARASRREELVLEFVQRELQAVLGLPSLPEPEVGFFDLGMDSLMAVEFRNRLNRGLAGEYVVSNTAAFDHASAAALTRHLAAALKFPGDGDAPPGDVSPAAVSDGEKERVRDLSEQDFIEEAMRALGKKPERP